MVEIEVSVCALLRRAPAKLGHRGGLEEVVVLEDGEGEEGRLTVCLECGWGACFYSGAREQRGTARSKVGVVKQ